MFWPCETRTSTCRNFATISSGLYRFLAITVLLDVKDIPQVGPLQWGWITWGIDQNGTPRLFLVVFHNDPREPVMAKFAEYLAKLSSDRAALAEFNTNPSNAVRAAGLTEAQGDALKNKDQAAIEAQLRDE